jgi:hypothetical protein
MDKRLKEANAAEPAPAWDGSIIRRCLTKSQAKTDLELLIFFRLSKTAPIRAGGRILRSGAQGSAPIKA